VFWSSEDALGGARLFLWRDSLRMSTEHLGLGYGPETFAREFPRHLSLELARAFPDFYHESPHNIFLDALLSKGLIGMIPLLALCLIGMTARDWLGGAFVAMLVSQQFSAFTAATELFFFVGLAMAVAETREQVAWKPRNRLAYWSGVCLFALPFAWFAMVEGTGDWLLASARRALDRGDLNEAARIENNAWKWNAAADV
jgi:hypothetical protein